MSDSKINKAKQEILHKVVNTGGTMRLDMVLEESKTWSIEIGEIKAVYYKHTPELEDKYWAFKSKELLNNTMEAIGVKQYYESVKDDNGSLIGLLAIYDLADEEVKTKHITKWVELNVWIKTNDLLQSNQNKLRSILNNDLFSKICVFFGDFDSFGSTIMSLLANEQELDKNNISWNFFNPNYLKYDTDIQKWTVSQNRANLNVVSVYDFRELLKKSNQKKQTSHE